MDEFKELDMVKILHDDQEKRKWLHARYGEVLDILSCSSVSSVFHKKLEELFPHIEQTVHQHQRELEETEYRMLITGETSGLDNLLHVLFGSTNLPIELIAKSDCYFEIKRHKEEQKSAIFHFNDKPDGRRRKPPILFNLCKQESLTGLSERIQEHEHRSQDEQYKKVELFWPLQFLHEGMTLAIVPRLPDAAEKIPKMAGLIYITKDEDVISSDLKQCISSQIQNFSSDTMLVVCSSKDKDETSNLEMRILDEIQALKPDISKQHLCFLSTEQQTRNEACKLIQSTISMMYPAVLKNHLYQHYRLVSSLLRKLLFLLESSLRNVSVEMDSITQKLDNLYQQSERLENNGNGIIEGVKDDIKQEIITMCETIEKIIKGDDEFHSLLTWELGDCPKADDNWKTIAKHVCEEIQYRIAEYVNKWEASADVIDGIKRKIISRIIFSLDPTKEQKQQIEQLLKIRETSSLSSSSLRKSLTSQTSVASVFKSSNRSSVIKTVISKGIGGAIVRDVTFDTDNPIVKTLCKAYKSNTCCEQMAEATKYFVNTKLNRDHLLHCISLFFQTLEENLDKVSIMISDMYEGNKKVIETLNNEVCELESSENIYTNMRKECVSFLTDLDLFYIQNIIQEHFSFRDLQLDLKCPIGRGDTFDVFNGELLRDNFNERASAIKISRNSVVEVNTVSELVLRETQIRTLSHTNLVKYWGTALRREKRGKRIEMNLVLIMEYCLTSLYSHCMSEDYKCPSRVDGMLSDDARYNSASFARQICQALEYIHSQNLVHGSLRLKNVFLTCGSVVKLKDVKFMYHSQILNYNVDHRIDVYTAPELLDLSGVVTYSSDLYSLGILLWELWYGIDANEHIKSQMFTSLRTSVKRGLRPSLSITERPPNSWVEIIKQCWAYDQQFRPDATTVKKFFASESDCHVIETLL